MNNKKIQLALLALMTSGFSAMYAPEEEFEPTETGEKGGGSGEGEGEGAIAAREGDGDEGTTSEPVDTASGGDTGLPSGQMDLQQTALTALAKRISTVVDSTSSLLDPTQTIGKDPLNDAVTTLKTSVQAIKKALNDETLTKKSSKKLLKTLSQRIKSLEGQRDILQQAGENVDDINTLIKNATELSEQVKTYAQDFGDSGNHSLADNALTSMESLLGKTTLSSQDIQDLRSTLKQLVDNASLDYLQANKSSIEAALEKMQGITKLPSDVTNNMTVLDAGMRLNDANTIIVANKPVLDSAFVRWINSFFKSVWDFLRGGDSQQADSLRTQIEEQVGTIVAQDKRTLLSFLSKEELSDADSGRIKTIIRRASAIKGMIDASNEAIGGVSSGEVDQLLTTAIETYKNIVWDMVLADEGETPLVTVFANSTQLADILVENIGKVPDVTTDTVRLPKTPQNLANAAIIAKRMEFLAKKTSATTINTVVEKMKRTFSENNITALRDAINELSSPDAIKQAMNSSLDTISQVLKDIGVNK